MLLLIEQSFVLFLNKICHTEWSQSDKDKYHDMAHMWNLKNLGANDLIYKTEIESQM